MEANTKRFALLALFILWVLLFETTASAVLVGQVDDFEDGTTMGWTKGAPSPNPPTNSATGGPLGVGDNYLQNISSGSSREAGGKMTMFNNVQWTGNYLTAGVTQIDAMMTNLGSTPLSMRVAIEGASDQRYASNTAIVLPADSAWYGLSFDLTAAGLVLVGGSNTLNTVLSNVTKFRIISAAAPSWHGDPIPATLGVDNITATPEPATICLLGFGAIALRKHRG